MGARRGVKAKSWWLVLVACCTSFSAIAHTGSSPAVATEGAAEPSDDAGPRWLRWRLLSPWYFIDKPMRLLHQRDQTNMLLLDLVRREPTGRSAERARHAMDSACKALNESGITEAQECPEVFACKVLPGGALVWSARHAPAGFSGARFSILMVSSLVEQLNDNELRALLALHFGQLLLSPEVPLWSWLPMFALGNVVRQFWAAGGELLSEVQAVLADLGLRPQPHAIFQKRKPPRTELWKTLLSFSPSLAMEVPLLSRKPALERACERMAIIAGGSASTAASAMTKARLPTTNLARLEQSKVIRHLLASQHPQAHPKANRAGMILALRAVVALVVTWGALNALRLSPNWSSLVIAMCLAVSATVCFILTLAVDFKVWQGFLAAAACYSGAVVLSCSQCSQQATRRAAVDSLVREVLPSATEAAAGVALLASAAAAARQIPLGQLDTELRSRWASALRSLSGKLADLRRLAGAHEASAPTRAWPLSSKLELEIRRVLVQETLWMRRALELEQDVALERALFWWLHDDGDGGCSGSPRLAVQVEQVDEWVNTQTLDKLKTPTLSATLASHELLRAPPIQDMALLQAAAAAMEEQYQQLDVLLKALRQATVRSETETGWPVLHALRGLWQASTCLREIEGAVAAFLKACDCYDLSTNAWGVSAVRRMQGHPMFGAANSSMGYDMGRRSRPGTADWRWALQSAAVGFGLLFVLVAVGFSIFQAPMWPEAIAFTVITTVLFCHQSSLRLPSNWEPLEQCLLAMSSRCGQMAAQVRGHDKDYPERLAHLKALVLVQGVQTAQNLEYLTLCVQAEALKNAKAKCDTQRRPVPPLGPWQLSPLAEATPREAPEEFTCRCMQLLLAVLPRQGRHGQRLVSTDVDVHRAMEWFDNLNHKKEPCAVPSSPRDSSQQRLQSLQSSLATGQRPLWMMYRLYDVRSIAKPAPFQGALTAVMLSQLGPIVLEHRLQLKEGELFTSMLNRPSQEFSTPRNSSRLLQGPPSGDDCGRILGDFDSTSVSNDAASVDSSSASGTVRRILQPSDSGSAASEPGRRALADLDGESDASSVASGVEVEGERRILAASVTSDGGSSDSASSAGGGSFALPSSMWSGVTYSAASSASTVTEDMLTHRRPLLEGYAHALRPLFMTRGDITHLLSKFPPQVLLGGTNCGRHYAAHRELLEELFGSLVVWVKSPERRGRIRLAFGASFRYSEEPYMLGSVMTTLQFMGDGVQRIGNEVCPMVPEENEGEEWAASECAASAARDAAPEQGALEFEEVLVPLTEVSSRELFLAELLQSDQCQLLASLSQGSHSKYGHRALRRRRRTLRHVREATQLLHSVPND